MISQTVEYALRAILTIAQQNGKSCTAKMTSEIARIPTAYLSKLMQGLVRAGLVNSQRGPNGGFVLNHKPHEITILQIVDAVDPLQRIHECPLGIKSHGTTLCPLHRRIDTALATIEEMFRSTTVAELLSEPDSVTPLCEEKTSGDTTDVVSLDLSLRSRPK